MKVANTGSPHALRKPRVFYGYWRVVATFFFAFIFSGCGFYAFSLFVKRLQADFGWGRGEIMATLTIFFLVGGITAPLIGWLVDRYGVRALMTIGAFVAGFGFTLLTLVTELWQFYGGYVIIGLGMAATGMTPSTAVVSNWFEKRRGMAIGVMSAGIGAGGLVLAPLIGVYLIPNFGWRVAYLALAVLAWMLIPLALFVIKTKPADMGLYPDGRQAPEPMAEGKASAQTSRGLTPRMVLSTTTFWLIVVSFITFGFSEVAILQNHVPYLEDVGFPAALAAGVHGIVGLWSTIGKFGFGWLCDRILPKYVCAIGLGLQLVATILLMNINPAAPRALLWLYAFIMGLGVGGWLPTMAMLVSTNFGLVAYGAIFGMIGFTQSFGSATGPLAAGYLYDAFGTYHWVFVIIIASYVVSTSSILAVRRPKSLQNGT